MKSLGRILCSAVLLTAGAGPALALDYEAKPIHWILAAPFRTAGAVSGATVCGLFSGPVDGGFHKTMQSEKKLAGEFGDENGTLQLMAAAPVSAPAGALVGGGQGFAHGVAHGWKTGWNKPFSRWSYITMEEK
jgi:hypothetical protein